MFPLVITANRYCGRVELASPTNSSESKLRREFAFAAGTADVFVDDPVFWNPLWGSITVGKLHVIINHHLLTQNVL